MRPPCSRYTRVRVVALLTASIYFLRGRGPILTRTASLSYRFTFAANLRFAYRVERRVRRRDTPRKTFKSTPQSDRYSVYKRPHHIHNQHGKVTSLPVYASHETTDSQASVPLLVYLYTVKNCVGLRLVSSAYHYYYSEVQKS